MRLRLWLAGRAVLAGCSVPPRQPYVERRDWRLAARHAAAPPPRTNRPVPLVRDLLAAPGLETRRLRWALPNGSPHVDFHEQWAVPPTQGVTDSVRPWPANAGLFAAAAAPGSQLTPDLPLEGELTEFLGDPAAAVARAALSPVLPDEPPTPARVLARRTEAAHHAVDRRGARGSGSGAARRTGHQAAAGRAEYRVGDRRAASDGLAIRRAPGHRKSRCGCAARCPAAMPAIRKPS
jgi:ABC-type uncharacterized transport system auxiliary subunit